jgi:hypothetical protein
MSKQIFVPDVILKDGSMLEHKVGRPRTPICPGCGAKFSHDPRTLTCKICLIPDEIALMGGDMIRRWKKFNLRQSGASKRQTKIIARGAAGSKTRRRNKPGRKGVK